VRLDEMRILVATLNSTRAGGVETYVGALLPRLQQRGYEVTFGYQHGATGRPTRAIDWPERSIHLVDEVGLRSVRPDAILMEGRLETRLEARLLGLAPVIFVAHDYAGACISGSKTWSFPRPVVCERTLGPACLLHFLPHRCGGLNPVLALRLFGEERTRQSHILHAARIIVSSEFLAKEYRRSGALESQIVVNPLFVQGPEASIPRELPAVPRIVYLGRLTELKGVSLLLEAVAMASETVGEIRLLVAGEGSNRWALEETARRLAVKAEFLGWLEPDDRDALLRAATLLVIPSIWPEPFGIVGLEAARFGVPAVAFPVGGIPEWLVGGLNGELAERQADPRALANAVVRAVAEAHHYRNLSKGALEVAERFSEERHMSLLTQAIEEVANTGTR
jgi:glycosyltransferase involved in cell wall biosynthesis